MSNLAVLIVAVPPAAAAGRLGKYFAKLDNREVFMRTIELYANRDQVLQRVLCVNVDDFSTIQAKYAAHLGFQGVQVAAGGPDWFSAVARGMEKLKPEIDTVILHDAACPAVSYHLLDALEKALTGENAGELAGVAPVTPMTGHVAKTAGDLLDITVDSASLQVVQSPQIFRRQALADAYGKLSAAASQKPGDDAALVRLAGLKVGTIPGSAFNLRIDTDELIRLGGDCVKHLPKPKRINPLTPFDEAQW